MCLTTETKPVFIWLKMDLLVLPFGIFMAYIGIEGFPKKLSWNPNYVPSPFLLPAPPKNSFLTHVSSNIKFTEFPKIDWREGLMSNIPKKTLLNSSCDVSLLSGLSTSYVIRCLLSLFPCLRSCPALADYFSSSLPKAKVFLFFYMHNNSTIISES